jgi:DNA-cytosine methyltransferase
LVRRCVPEIVGPRGEELFYLTGPSHISLFTGAGGMDIGLEEAGYCTLVQHEWWDAACQTLIINRPEFFRHAALIQGDIRQTPTSMLLSEAGLRVGECHIVTGGPPCQGFSHANSDRTAGDPRNSLVFEYLRVVREAQPHFFIMENVPGFCDLEKGWFLDELLKTAYAAYYELVYGIVNASEHGVPQHRNRFFCMGTRRDLWECEGVLAALPPPTHFHQGDLDRMQILSGTPSLFPGLVIGDAEELQLLQQAPGIRYFPDRPVLKPPCPTSGEGRTKTFLDFYRRIRREEPDRLVFKPAA